MTHFLALGPGVTLGGFEGLCLSWLRVISERDHSWDVEGEPPTDVQIFTKILTCSWSGGHSQLTHDGACVRQTYALFFEGFPYMHKIFLKIYLLIFLE